MAIVIPTLRSHRFSIDVDGREVAEAFGLECACTAARTLVEDGYGEVEIIGPDGSNVATAVSDEWGAVVLQTTDLIRRWER